MRQTPVLASLILFASLCLGIDTADAQCALPYTLTNGTTADATQVMANFNAVIGCFPAEPFAIAIGGTGQSSAQAAFDALSPLMTQGDVLYFNGSHNTRLAAGTVGYFLQTGGAGANPSWATALIPGNNLSDVSNTSTARSNLGLGTASTYAASAFAQTANNLSDLANLTTARTNLSAAKSGANSDITSLTGLTTDLPINEGGTGAGTAQAAFDALSPLAAQGDLPYYNGTHNTRLAAGTSGYFLKTSGSGANPSWAQALIPGNNLNDVSNASTARSNLGLGTTSQPGFEALTLDGSYSAPFVGTRGYRYQTGGSTIYTDTTGGSEGEIAVDTLLPPTLAATVATTYSQAETLRVGTCPSAGTNVTIASGKCYSAFFNGAIDVNGQATAGTLDANTQLTLPDGITYTALGFGAVPTFPSQLPGLFFAGACGTGFSDTPTFRALCGADLPNPSTSSLGGIESIAAVSHKWVNAISTSGVPSQTQPACGDLSNSGTGCQTGVVTTQSWTPTILGSTTAGTWTYSMQNGYYTKISDGNGCTVIAHGRITTSADSGSPAGNAEIGGLPLTSADQSGIFPGTVEFGLVSGVNLDTGYAMLQGTVTASGTVAAIREAGSGKIQANVAIGNITAHVASFDIVFTITYNATGC